MRRIQLILTAIAMLSFVACKTQVGEASTSDESNLKEAFEGKFLIGTALNTPQSLGEDTASLNVVKKHFNSIVAENCMKSEVLQPKQGVFDFEQADKMVEFGLANDMFIVGHTLVWHAQTADWMFIDDAGNDVSRDTLIERMKKHIYTVVGRYKGRVHGWDVVNEAIIDSVGLRKSKYYSIIGPDYIELAFQFAHEADPEAELYYNDYNMYKPHKREVTIDLVKSLKEKGLRVDAIGMQAHYGLGMNILSEIEESIVSFAEIGVKVMVTELDVSILPFPTQQITAEISQSYANKPEFNPYVEVVPDSVQQAFSDFYVDLFKIYNKHADKISRVTFWGVNDSQTWRNYWPINGRTDYPLFFDRNNQAKPVLKEVVNATI